MFLIIKNNEIIGRFLNIWECKEWIKVNNIKNYYIWG